MPLMDHTLLICPARCGRTNNHGHSLPAPIAQRCLNQHEAQMRNRCHLVDEFVHGRRRRVNGCEVEINASSLLECQKFMREF